MISSIHLPLPCLCPLHLLSGHKATTESGPGPYLDHGPTTLIYSYLNTPQPALGFEPWTSRSLCLYAANVAINVAKEISEASNHTHHSYFELKPLSLIVARGRHRPMFVNQSPEGDTGHCMRFRVTRGHHRPMYDNQSPEGDTVHCISITVTRGRHSLPVT